MKNQICLNSFIGSAAKSKRKKNFCSHKWKVVSVHLNILSSTYFLLFSMVFSTTTSDHNAARIQTKKIWRNSYRTKKWMESSKKKWTTKHKNNKNHCHRFIGDQTHATQLWFVVCVRCFFSLHFKTANILRKTVRIPFFSCCSCLAEIFMWFTIM